MSKTTLVFGVTYHGSIDRSAGGLDNLYGKHISARALNQQLTWLARYFRILPISEILERGRQGTLPSRSAFIAFHDGYRGNYETAFPMLQALGLHVDFFIPTAFIGTDYRFWVDVLDAALKYTRAESLTLPDQSGESEIFPLQNDTERVAAAHRLRNRLKALAQGNFEGEFMRVLHELGYDDPKNVPVLGDHSRCLDWGQVREMAQAGMSIGSHTHRHLICAAQTEKTVRSEMALSKELIERETGQPCHNFCYPNGRYPENGNDLTDRIACEMGFKSVLYMMSGANLVHPETFRLTGVALSEGAPIQKLKTTFSRYRFQWRRWRGDKIWSWETDAIGPSEELST